MEIWNISWELSWLVNNKELVTRKVCSWNSRRYRISRCKTIKISLGAKVWNLMKRMVSFRETFLISHASWEANLLNDYKAIFGILCSSVKSVHGQSSQTSFSGNSYSVEIYQTSNKSMHIPHFHEWNTEIDCHIVHEKIRVIQTKHLSTAEQPKDLFTKALGSSEFHQLLGKLDV